MMLRACSTTDCLEYATEGPRCPEHTRETTRKKRLKRASAPGNGSARRLRALINTYHAWTCQKCERTFSPSDIEVDHKLALADGGTDYDSNTWGICHWCHSEKTATENAARRS